MYLLTKENYPMRCGSVRDPAKELDLPKNSKSKKKSQLHNVLEPRPQMNINVYLITFLSLIWQWNPEGTASLEPHA